MLFDNLPKHLITLKDTPCGEALRELPQFFRADLDMAWRMGGQHVQRVLMVCANMGAWKYISVDSRLHMLMPGMWPCIPGWHCDDFHRPPRTAPNPDLLQLPPAEHTAVIFGDCSRTEFLYERTELDVTPPADGSPLYRRMDAEIRRRPRVTRFVEPGELWRFSPWTLHRGSAATHAGWRYYIRITGSDHHEPRNELRTQTQVYLTEPFAGW